MKKRSYVSCLGALAVAMTLVTTSLTGGTMAKYATVVTGSATATVAAWSFKATQKDETTEITNINLGSPENRKNYAAGTVRDGVIAPGTEGDFDIVINGVGSDVGIEYSLLIKPAIDSNLPDGFMVKVDGNEYDLSLGEKVAKVTGKIAYDEDSVNMKKTVNVSWTWPIGENTDDNAYQSEKLSLDIIVTGTQQTPTTSNP